MSEIKTDIKQLKNRRCEIQLFLKSILGIHASFRRGYGLALNNYVYSNSDSGIKHGTIKHKRMEVYLEENTIASLMHEYVHVLRNKRHNMKTDYRIIYGILSAKLRKNLIISDFFDAGINEATAELAEIAYIYYSNFSPDNSIEDFFKKYIDRTGIDNESCYSLFYGIMHMEDYTKHWFYQYRNIINKKYQGQYSYNIVFGIYIAYIFLKINNMDITAAFNQLYHFNGKHVVSILMREIDNSEVLSPIVGNHQH